MLCFIYFCSVNSISTQTSGIHCSTLAAPFRSIRDVGLATTPSFRTRKIDRGTTHPVSMAPESLATTPPPCLDQTIVSRVFVCSNRPAAPNPIAVPSRWCVAVFQHRRIRCLQIHYRRILHSHHNHRILHRPPSPIRPARMRCQIPPVPTRTAQFCPKTQPSCTTEWWHRKTTAIWSANWTWRQVGMARESDGPRFELRVGNVCKRIQKLYVIYIASHTIIYYYVKFKFTISRRVSTI